MNLDVQAVTKDYGDRHVLSPTSLTIQEKEFVSIVGPSGCGKSTLLMMMAGLLDATSGRIVFDGAPISEPPMGMAVVFQDYSRSLFPWLTVRRNLSMATAAYRLPKAEVAKRIDEALVAVGLPGTHDLYPYQMSGGMQQRVAIARALVVQPKIMLMDEPFAAVDAQTRADLEDLLLRVRFEYHVTVAFVTHDIDEAVYLGDRVVVLAAGPGRIVADIPISLPRPRDQITTKLEPDFARLRSQVFELVMRPR